MLGLLYFGRLDKEKGVDGIIEMVHLFAKKGKIPFELFIFGRGELEEEILALASQYQEIHFFGWKTLSEIQRYVQNCQYCLMPSTFLETFGLSALTALTRGLPVIGYRKGGLTPFIEEHLDLSLQTGSTTGTNLYHLIQDITTHKIIQPLIDTTIREQKYSKKNREISLQQLLGEKKKILLVSDFVSKVGGIETYIHDVKTILENLGYEVKLFGTSLPHGMLGKIKKLLGIGLGLGNVFEALRLHRMCKNYKPDLIRYHSTLRRLGWLPLWTTAGLKTERWVMYHDFGYFYPYPSQLTDTKQIQTPMSIRTFFAMAKTKNPIRLLLLLGKYTSICLLKKQLHTVDKHFVPSEFMENIVAKSFSLPHKLIFTLSHFLQK